MCRTQHRFLLLLLACLMAWLPLRSFAGTDTAIHPARAMQMPAGHAPCAMHRAHTDCAHHVAPADQLPHCSACLSLSFAAAATDVRTLPLLAATTSRFEAAPPTLRLLVLPRSTRPPQLA